MDIQLQLFVATTKSVDELAKFLFGLEHNTYQPPDYIWLMGAGLVILVLLLLFLNWKRRRLRRALLQDWATISEPNQLEALMLRASARRARCTLEIFDHHHTNIYRGHVYQSLVRNHLVLELDQIPAENSDFSGFPAQVHFNFNPGVKQKMEHYQFSGHTLWLAVEQEKNWRVARVRVSWPKSVISAQRRDFLRIESLAEHHLTADIRPAPASPPTNPEAFSPLARGSVLDISVGGIQILFAELVEIAENEEMLLSLSLPTAGLDIPTDQQRLHLLFSTLYYDHVTSDQIENASNPDSNSHTIIRGKFTGRYCFISDTQKWQKQSSNLDNFQDLAYWINAYQRYLLNNEKGLQSITLDRVNRYPAIPPIRPVPKDD